MGEDNSITTYEYYWSKAINTQKVSFAERKWRDTNRRKKITERIDRKIREREREGEEKLKIKKLKAKKKKKSF